MGSLAEDEAGKRHSHAPPPPLPPPAQPWHAAPFPPAPAPPLLPPAHFLHPSRTHETVINGTTWYHPPPPRSSDSHFLPPSAPSRYGSLPPPRSSDSHFLPPSAPSRYGSLPPFNNFDTSPRSHPSSHRHPHAFPPTGSSSSNRGVAPPYAAASGFIPAYPRDDGPHDAVGRGYTYSGTDSTYGIMPGYPYNGQHAYYHYDGYGRPYIPSPADGYSTMSSPAMLHGVLPRPAREYGSMQMATASYGGYPADYGSNASYGMPPHAIRTSGKTFRQAVTWCGMTMPVTITSQTAAIVEWIQRQAGDLFGFDLEWKPNRLKGEDNLVALLQICGPADCLIVQMLYTDMIPKLLKEFLSNARKRLGGVGIRQDVKKLERDHDLVCQGQVELGTLAAEKLKRDDLQGTGLKKLVDQVLGMTLVKIKKITMSNWEKEYLDEKQIEYACIDAWAAFAILQKLTTL